MGNCMRVSHICIKVKDLEKAEAFYTGVLGMEVVSRETLNGMPLVVLGQGIGLNLCDEPHLSSFDHIGIRVESIDIVVEALKKAGVPIISGPKKSVYGTNLYFRDPDDNRIECHDADRGQK